MGTYTGAIGALADKLEPEALILNAHYDNEEDGGVVIYRRRGGVDGRFEYIVHTFNINEDGRAELFWGHYFNDGDAEQNAWALYWGKLAIAARVAS